MLRPLQDPADHPHHFMAPPDSLPFPFCYDAYEDYLSSIWGRNPEFARKHTDLPSPSTTLNIVCLRSLFLHPTDPEPAPPSLPKPSPFAGTRLAFSPKGVGPRRRQGDQGSCSHRWTKLPVDGGPILHQSVLILLQSSSPAVLASSRSPAVLPRSRSPAVLPSSRSPSAQPHSSSLSVQARSSCPPPIPAQSSCPPLTPAQSCRQPLKRLSSKLLTAGLQAKSELFTTGCPVTRSFPVPGPPLGPPI